MTPELEAFLNSYGTWISGVIATIAVAAATYGGIKVIYCKGKNDDNTQNRIRFLEQENEDLHRELDLLKSDIKEYRSEIKDQLNVIESNQANMKTDIEVTKNHLCSINENIKWIRDSITKLLKK